MSGAIGPSEALLSANQDPSGAPASTKPPSPPLPTGNGPSTLDSTGTLPATTQVSGGPQHGATSSPPQAPVSSAQISSAPIPTPAPATPPPLVSVIPQAPSSSTTGPLGSSHIVHMPITAPASMSLPSYSTSTSTQPPNAVVAAPSTQTSQVAASHVAQSSPAPVSDPMQLGYGAPPPTQSIPVQASVTHPSTLLPSPASAPSPMSVNVAPHAATQPQTGAFFGAPMEPGSHTVLPQTSTATGTSGATAVQGYGPLPLHHLYNPVSVSAPSLIPPSAVPLQMSQVPSQVPPSTLTISTNFNGNVPPNMAQPMGQTIPPVMGSAPAQTIPGMSPMNRNAVPAGAPAVPMQGQPVGEAMQQPTQLKLESALGFLGKVKNVFENKPGVYTKFLDIMKDFKAHTIDTPGVIERVKELFHGHPDLILGFNTFLPSGYRITMADLMPQAAPPQPPPPQQLPQQPPQQQQQQQQPEPGRKLEFDLARHYVKKIKTRFATKPNIYKQFLEILYTYHKEQQPIQQVYDKVASLFRAHRDLLDEFTQFLPDSNARMPTQSEINSREKQRESHDTGRAAVQQVEAQRRSKRTTTTKVTRPARSFDSERAARPGGSSGTFTEMEHFVRIKIHLGEKRWGDFLKCLHLFNNDVVDKTELLSLVRSLLMDNTFELRWLYEFVGADPSDLEDDEPYLGELDLSNCELNGTSYRRRPSTFILKPTSGRGPAEQAVLNDDWISRPHGEEGFNISVKNQWEEQMFKAEDDRFEWDVYELRNIAARDQLSMIQHRLESLPLNEQKKYQLKEGDLSFLHKLAIKTIYYPRGEEILKLLQRHPFVTIPFVMKRIAQKDAEWIKLKQPWRAKWRALNENNWVQSADQQSHIFLQSQKKDLAPKTIIDELETRVSARDEGFTGADYEYALMEPDCLEDMRSLMVALAAKAVGTEGSNQGLTGFIESFFSTKSKASSMDGNGHSYDGLQPVTIRVNRADNGVCPPLVPHMSLDPTTRVFYGNSVFFVLFRYIGILYQRLASAKAACANPTLPVRHLPPIHLALPSQSSESSSNPLSKPPEVEEQILFHEPPRLDPPPLLASRVISPPSTTAEAIAERYENYAHNLRRLALNNLDKREFEDGVRNSLGVFDVEIIVMEKLLSQLVQQINLISGNVVCNRLINVYQYQQQREEPKEDYFFNVAEILREKKCFRATFDVNTRVLTLTQVEPSPQLRASGDTEQTIKPPTTSSAIKGESLVTDAGLHPHWEDCFRSLVDGKAVEVAQGKSKTIYLKRNVFSSTKSLGPDPLKSVFMLNELACSLDPQTLRPLYLENSTDVFIRRRDEDRPRRLAVGKGGLEGKIELLMNQ